MAYSSSKVIWLGKNLPSKHLINHPNSCTNKFSLKLNIRSSKKRIKTICMCIICISKFRQIMSRPPGYNSYVSPLLTAQQSIHFPRHSHTRFIVSSISKTTIPPPKTLSSVPENGDSSSLTLHHCHFQVHHCPSIALWSSSLFIGQG